MGSAASAAHAGGKELGLKMLLRWIRLKRYCEESGDTPDAVDARVRAGHWLRDVHVRRPEGSKELWVSLAAVNDWAEGKKPAHHHGSAKPV